MFWFEINKVLYKYKESHTIGTINHNIVTNYIYRQIAHLFHIYNSIKFISYIYNSIKLINKNLQRDIMHDYLLPSNKSGKIFYECIN